MSEFINDSWQRAAMLNTVLLKVETDKIIRYGTGFLFLLWNQEDQERKMAALFLVSNRHVLQNAIKIVANFHCPAGKLEPGMSFRIREKLVRVHLKNQKEIQLNSSDIIYHDNIDVDLACVECNDLLGMDDIVIAPFSSEKILNWEESSLYPGQQLLFVGYPKRLIDAAHNMPIARTASLASFPELDFNGKPDFLIDGVVWEGSSGSPVFIPDSEKNSFSMVGVITQYRIAERELKRTDKGHPIRIDENISIGVAVKSSEILKMLGVE